MSHTRASVALRVATPAWEDAAAFARLLQALDDAAGATDELALFTSITHSPVALSTFRPRMPVAKERMALARRHGLAAGLNILTTVGHHEEDLDGRPAGDYTPMTDLRGRVSRGSFCPNDPTWRRYVEELYASAVTSEPDFIWIDDDVRLFGHLPVGACCFCDRCLELFSDAVGRSFRREELERAFNDRTPEETVLLRRAWLAHNRRTILRLFELIERTVHAARPWLSLGFMTGERPYEGYDFAEEARVLAGPGGASVRWRPGGGFYTEDAPRLLAGKSHEIGRQIAALPSSVRPIQSEIESFPYQRLQKSVHTTVTEAACHIAAGCTGAAWNVFSGQREPLDEYLPVFRGLGRARPFLDEVASALGGSPPVGAWLVWNLDIFSGAHVPVPAARAESASLSDPGRWPDAGVGSVMSSSILELFELGIPAAYARPLATVSFLTVEAVLAAGEDELRSILSGGVYMDASALERLADRGLGDLAGFRVISSSPVDRMEQLVPHELNGAYAGFIRDCRQSFWHADACALEPRGSGAEILSRLLDYGGKVVADCAMGVFTNALGGRVCVSGYYPWRSIQNAARCHQTRAVARWLSRDRLPGYVSSLHRANLWLRSRSGSAESGLVLNASLEPAEELELRLRTDSDRVTLTDAVMARTELDSSGADGPYRVFRLPRLEPWSAYLLDVRRHGS